jgi:hypothetical protein
MKYFKLAPEWITFYWWSVAILGMQWLADASTIFEPRMRPVRQFIGMAGRAATVVVMAWMLRVPTFLWLSDLGRENGKLDKIPEALNMALHLGFRVVIAITVGQLLWEIVKIFTRRSNSGLQNGSTQTAL